MGIYVRSALPLRYESRSIKAVAHTKGGAIYGVTNLDLNKVWLDSLAPLVVEIVNLVNVFESNIFVCVADDVEFARERIKRREHGFVVLPFEILSAYADVAYRSIYEALEDSSEHYGHLIQNWSVTHMKDFRMLYNCCEDNADFHRLLKEFGFDWPRLYARALADFLVR